MTLTGLGRSPPAAPARPSRPREPAAAARPRPRGPRARPPRRRRRGALSRRLQRAGLRRSADVRPSTRATSVLSKSRASSTVAAPSQRSARANCSPPRSALKARPAARGPTRRRRRARRRHRRGAGQRHALVDLVPSVRAAAAAVSPARPPISPSLCSSPRAARSRRSPFAWEPGRRGDDLAPRRARPRPGVPAARPRDALEQSRQPRALLDQGLQRHAVPRVVRSIDVREPSRGAPVAVEPAPRGRSRGRSSRRASRPSPAGTRRRVNGPRRPPCGRACCRRAGTRRPPARRAFPPSKVMSIGSGRS